VARSVRRGGPPGNVGLNPANHFAGSIGNDRQDALDELKAAGKPSIKKVLMNHGACEPFYGVSVEDLKKIQETDQARSRPRARTLRDRRLRRDVSRGVDCR